MPDANAGKRTPPVPLWITVGAIAMATFVFVLTTRRSEVALAGAALNVVGIWGLVRGHKWAYLAAIFCGMVGVIVSFGKGATVGLAALLGNAIVLVPMLMSTSYFFPEKKLEENCREPNSTGNQKQGEIL